MTFVLLGTLDVWALSSSIRQKQSEFSPEVDGARFFVLRETETAKWPQANNVLARIKRLHSGIEILSAFLEWLEPGATIEWREDRLSEARLCVYAHPGAVEFSGAEPCYILPGSLMAISPGWRSSVNFSEFRRIHLVMGIRRKEAA